MNPIRRSAFVIPTIVILVAGAHAGVPVAAQTIHGQVVDSITGVPVGAGFVVLTAAGGPEIQRLLTSPDGRFRFDVAGITAPVTLRSERIGFRLFETDPFALANTDLEVELRIAALPMRLAMIEVREASECAVSPARADQVALVWEEARKALAAATWTASEERYQLVSNIHERDLDRRKRVINERHRPARGWSSLPFASLDPAALLEDGYVVAAPGGGFTYTAPDAHVVQDESFLATHCFRLERSGGDPSLIGLAFEPAPSRVLPDIEGVLWMDRESGELRSLRYEYTNLSRELPARDPGGGEVEFLPLPSGAWIVHRWRITMPTAFHRELADRFARDSTVFVDAYRETGGEVLSLTDSAGAVVFRAPMAELAGTVTDSLNDGFPLQGAQVQVVGTWFADTTGENGRYRLRVPLDGEYEVFFTHARTDSVGFVVPAVRVRLARGQTVSLNLTVPSWETVFRSVCNNGDGANLGANTRVLVGTVVDERNRARAGVPVQATWQRIADNLDFRDMIAETRTDSDGRFGLCGFDLHRPALLQAAGPNQAGDLIRVEFDQTGVQIGDDYYLTDHPIWRKDLTVRRRTDHTAGTIAGIVSASRSHEPLPNVSISLEDGGTTHTDSTGVFQLAGLAPRTYRTTVSRPGYRSRRGTAVVRQGETTVLGAELTSLEPAVQVIGSVADLETGEPVTGVQISLFTEQGDTVAMSYSDSAGAFVVTATAPGSYFVGARRLGFTVGTGGPVAAALGEPGEANFTLRRIAFGLDPIMVTAAGVNAYLTSVGFYDRRVANRGFFMNPEQVQQRAGAVRDVGQLLTLAPGIQVVEGIPGSSGSLISVERGGISLQGCRTGPAIFLDGSAISIDATGGGGGGGREVGGSQAQPQFAGLSDAVLPEDVAAIEVYRSPSQIPVQYGGAASACGVILIWTMRGYSR